MYFIDKELVIYILIIATILLLLNATRKPGKEKRNDWNDRNFRERIRERRNNGSVE